MTLSLSQAPSAPIEPSLEVRVGRYQGWLDTVCWGYPGGWLKGQVLRAFGRKRWFQACLNLGDRLVVLRIIDQGLSGSGTLWSVHLPSGHVEVADSALGAPLRSLVVGPMAGQGADAFLKSKDLVLRVRRGKGEKGFWVEAKREGWHLSCSLELSPEHQGLVVIGQQAIGKKGLSQRLTGLHVRGTLRTSAGVQGLSVADAASIEYVNGFLARPAGWSSALVWPEKVGDTWEYASELEALSGLDESAQWQAGRLVALGEHPGEALEALSANYELTPVARFQEHRGLPEQIADLAEPLSCINYQHEFILGRLRNAEGAERLALFEGRLFG